MALLAIGFSGGLLTIGTTFALSDRAAQVGRIDAIEKSESTIESQIKYLATKEDIANLRADLLEAKKEKR